MWDFITWVFKIIFFMILAHLLMPFIVTGMSVFLIEYWTHLLFQTTLMQLAVGLGVVGSIFTIFWIVFALFHLVFAFNWWFFRDVDLD